MRYENYKLVWGVPSMLHRFFKKSSKKPESLLELYNLTNDPEEKLNIASDNKYVSILNTIKYIAFGVLEVFG